MKALIQRVSSASVSVDGECCASISRGFLVFLGVTHGDTKETAEKLAEKIRKLRIFEDEEGKMNQSLLQKSGEMLVVSQFTLYGDVRHGRRPSFTAAAPPDLANRLYEEFVQYVEKQGVRVATGVFQTEMVVSLDNHGPVTILLDSKKEF